MNIIDSHFSDILFSKFRLGWKMSVDAIPLNSSSKPNLQTFMVVVEKELSTTVHQITLLLRNASLNCNSEQVEYRPIILFCGEHTGTQLTLLGTGTS
jgi:hypothetical protein